MSTSRKALLDLWYGDGWMSGTLEDKNQIKWWKQSDEFDDQLRQFVPLYDTLMSGATIPDEEGLLEEHKLLADILVLDQLTRSCFRKTGKAFSGDAKAVIKTKQGLTENLIEKLPLEIQRMFALMPLLLSESLEDQNIAEVSRNTRMSSKNSEGSLRVTSIWAEKTHQRKMSTSLTLIT